MVVDMILYLLILVLVKISIVEPVWTCRDAQCLREPRDGLSPYRSLNYDKEAPYVVAFEDVKSNDIFCLGVLISSQYALSTYVCMEKTKTISDFSILYGSKNIHSMQTQRRKTGLVTYTVCGDSDWLWKECDFATVKIDPPFINSKTAVIPRGEPETVAELLQKSMIDTLNCVGVGFGRYEIWTQVGRDSWKAERAGKNIGVMSKFHMRLLTDYTCSSEATTCCGTEFKQTGMNYFKKVNCAARGKKLSPCFGESGGPVICNGYVFGLLKGTLQCPIEQKKKTNILGFMLYAGINHALVFIKGKYLKTYEDRERPVPELGDFDAEVDYEGRAIGGDKPPLPANMTKNPRGSAGGGKGEEDDDYDYYDYANNVRPQNFIVLLGLFLYNLVYFKL